VALDQTVLVVDLVVVALLDLERLALADLAVREHLAKGLPVGQHQTTTAMTQIFKAAVVVEQAA
jgi:hypothetical protein